MKVYQINTFLIQAFQHIIKTLAELKHVQAKKAGKVITQGYIGILHSILNMKRKIKEKINTP